MLSTNSFINGKASEEDRKWMWRALSLARLSEGCTRPNPPVGAVVVKNGVEIGSGRHLKAGGPHAEVNAFDSCRKSAVGSTLYVTLEPCSTTGRTPPCTDRILREGVSRVVVGCIDRNSRHCGKGIELLRQHGVEVVSGVCEADALKLVEPFFKHISTGMPFVTLKLGMTMDGRIADRYGTSQWITGEPARRQVQQLRRRADAVMVGSGTVLADNPSLLCRIGGGDNLLRVAIDSRAKTAKQWRRWKIFTDQAAGRTIVATGEDRVADFSAAQANGVRVWGFKLDPDGHLPLTDLLRRLGAETNAMHLLCEGGGGLAGALHHNGLVDEYRLFQAPAILNDGRAMAAFSFGEHRLADMRRLKIVKVQRVGSDLLTVLRPDGGPSAN